jgi:hypothetical protein
MAIEGNLEYASARVHALHGRLPEARDWRRLEASRDLAHFLESARNSPLSGWVSSFDTRQDVHAIERSLRSQWMGHVQRVASWHPREHQAWLRWLAFLPMLPLLAHLATPEPAAPWLLADPVCGGVAIGSPAQRAAALAKTPLAPLAPAINSSAPIAALWRQQWIKLTPRFDPDTQGHLDRLVAAVDQHASALSRGGSTPALRSRLGQRLQVLFRASSETVVATVCHLGRLAVDLERLRGGIAGRFVLARPAGEAA